MQRFHLPPDQCQAPTLILPEREAHHAHHVLRLRRGDGVVVLDGAGREMACEVDEIARRALKLKVREVKTIPPLPYRIALIQAIPKGKLFDTIVQKATELGASRIVPLLSERVTARLDDAQSLNKVEHWRQTAIESIKQCGSAWLPRIDAPLSPAEFLAQSEAFDLALVGSLQPGSRHPRALLREFQARHKRRPLTVAVWVGPEGDFTVNELDAIQGSGAQPITLGPLVLRSDTAAVYCLSVLSYELQASED